MRREGSSRRKAGPAPAGCGTAGYASGVDWQTLRQNVGGFLQGAAYGRHRTDMRLAALELNDLFMLLCYLELMGIPNPATLYLLDLYPLLLEEFHLWHRRMGVPHSPLDSLPCC